MAHEDLLLNIFKSSDLAFGQSHVSKEQDTRGKRAAKHWTEKRPVNIANWAAHVHGDVALGLSPINSKNSVHWGAIDIDVYNNAKLHEEYCMKLSKLGVPATVTRSKSGGVHIFFLLSEWVPAETMLNKLQEIAAYLGRAAAEIFPKQTTLKVEGTETPDYGNWISMPFFGGKRALMPTSEGPVVVTLDEWIQISPKLQMSAKELGALAMPVPEDVFPDGPPCLNQLFTEPQGEGSRNILLFNAAVYHKMAGTTNLDGALQKANSMFQSPLPLTELSAIIRGINKKDYCYQCRTEPLKSFCNSRKCRSLQFGVGHKSFLPGNQSLTMLATDPPLWYVDLTLKNGESKRISLTTDQLQKPGLFQKRVMEVLQEMPPVPKIQEWQETVQGMMSSVKIIEMPEEMTRVGQFLELLEEFLDNAGDDAELNNVSFGSPVRMPEGYYFRMKDLLIYLASMRVNTLAPNEITAALKNQCHASRVGRKVDGRFYNLWFLPRKSEERVEEKEPF